MKRLMLAALHSGAGKTVAVCGLLAAMKRRGLPVTAFKCGPDYIDPLFHTRVLGVPSRNLDLYLQGAEGVARTLSRAGEGWAILEGAMGFYDGLAGTDEASAWQLADLTDTPVLLVVRPGGAALTLAAQIKGMQTFRTPSRLAGILLTDCKPSLAAYLRPLLERETGLPVVGFLPHIERAVIDSRHLGLRTAGEIADLSARVDAVADEMARTVDLDALLALAQDGPAAPPPPSPPAPRCRVAVAQDEAFCFCYADNLDALRAAGAQPVFFSPLHDRALPPDCDGLYLVGGYPELYARALSENTAMRQAVAAAVEAGLPTVAECGGFLYLQRELEDASGRVFPQCGVLDGRGYPTERLVRFGYHTLQCERDCLLLRSGESLPVHEFHYWDCTRNGDDLIACKPDGRRWQSGVATGSLFAAFEHLHFGGRLPLAERFATACTERKHA